MKATLLQQDKITQLVLTPETEWEKKALKAVPEKNFIILRGSFFQSCQGGWVREFQDDESLMFVSQEEPSHEN